MANQVRATIMELDDVDPEIQQAILEEFMKSQRTDEAPNAPQPVTKNVTHASSSDVELDLQFDENQQIELTESYSNRWNSGRNENTESDSVASQEMFAFLSEVDTPALLVELEKEHPQTVAVVMVNIPPRRAAELLEKIPVAMQTEVVRRMIDLDDMDPSVLQELAQGFAKQLEQHLKQKRRRVNGMSRIANILAVSQKETEERILQNLERHRSDAILNTTQRQRVSVTRDHAQANSNNDSPSTIPFRQTKAVTPESNGPKFRDLIALTDDALLHVLQHVPSEAVVIALSGADASVVNRITRRLQKKQAEMLQRALAHLGPMRINEVEAAQHELVRKALELGLLRTN